MRSVMYGGGNIGRGFIGALLSQSGYQMTFVDVAEPVVTALSERHTYPIRYVDSGGYEDMWIENVTAVNGNDMEAVSDAIAECDLLATAVGARVLEFIVPNLVAGLRKRWAAGAKPLNILICENLNDANKVLEGLLKAQLTGQERDRFDETVGLVEASIGRMVPVQTEEMKDGEPMRVCVERYGFLPLDGAAFKGTLPEIQGMVPYEPFDFYVKRKLYLHNMGHATCAYLGDFLGLTYISEAIDVPDIRLLVQNAMLESTMALAKAYSVPLSELQLHMTDLLHRFTNTALKDTCLRVGGDPARKLGRNDRLIGAAKLALEQGITPTYIAAGAAAGLRRYLDENSQPQSEAAALAALETLAALGCDEPLTRLIVKEYTWLQENPDVGSLRKRCDVEKASSLGPIV